MGKLTVGLGMADPTIDAVADAHELHYLQFFFQTADFGPAHEDVVSIINDRYIDAGNTLPAAYKDEEY